MFKGVKNEEIKELLILSPSPKDEISIGRIAELIAKELNYLDRLKYDTSKSAGQYRKTADNGRLIELYGELTLIDINEGIKNTVNWFRNNYENCRK